MNVQPFRPVGATQTLNVTSTAASLTLSVQGAQASCIRVLSQGSAVPFIATGVGSATANAASSMALLPAAVEIFCKGLDDTISLCTSSGTSTVYVTAGEGQ